ncbi:ribokinase [Rhizobium binxianense]
MRAFVVGNVTIDETIGVPHLPATGASIHGHAFSRDLGGKGANQAVILARAGVETTFIGATGDDERGSAIRGLLAGEPLDCRLVELPGAASDVSIILVLPDGNNAIVTTTDSADHLAVGAVMSAMADATAGDVLVLQGNLSAAATGDILRFARLQGMRTVANPSPIRDYFRELWPLIDIVFLNEGEAEALTGATGSRAAAILIEKGVRQVVITLGAKGAALFGNGPDVTVGAINVTAVDTTGAGDTFAGVALASAVGRGCSLDRRALEEAVAAAALTVSRKGTRSAFPSAAELAVIRGGSAVEQEQH